MTLAGGTTGAVGRGTRTEDAGGPVVRILARRTGDGVLFGGEWRSAVAFAVAPDVLIRVGVQQGRRWQIVGTILAGDRDETRHCPLSGPRESIACSKAAGKKPKTQFLKKISNPDRIWSYKINHEEEYLPVKIKRSPVETEILQPPNYTKLDCTILNPFT